MKKVHVLDIQSDGEIGKSDSVSKKTIMINVNRVYFYMLAI